MLGNIGREGMEKEQGGNEGEMEGGSKGDDEETNIMM